MSDFIPRIYLADDDPVDRAIVIDVLKKNGFASTIMEFDNGKLLLSSLKNAHLELPDLIVLDLNMPVKDGYWALHQLKSSRRLKEIPVVILTASSKEKDKTDCLAQGVKSYFSKPMSMREYTGIALSIMILCSAH